MYNLDKFYAITTEFLAVSELMNMRVWNALLLLKCKHAINYALGLTSPNYWCPLNLLLTGLPLNAHTMWYYAISVHSAH